MACRSIAGAVRAGTVLAQYSAFACVDVSTASWLDGAPIKETWGSTHCVSARDSVGRGSTSFVITCVGALGRVRTAWLGHIREARFGAQGRVRTTSVGFDRMHQLLQACLHLSHICPSARKGCEVQECVGMRGRQHETSGKAAVVSCKCMRSRSRLYTSKPRSAPPLRREAPKRSDLFGDVIVWPRSLHPLPMHVHRRQARTRAHAHERQS